jgi:hypothetical protein
MNDIRRRPVALDLEREPEAEEDEHEQPRALPRRGRRLLEARVDRRREGAAAFTSFSPTNRYPPSNFCMSVMAGLS